MRLRQLLIIAGLCLPAALFAQTKSFNYDARWKVVDSLYGKKGLTESALAEVNRIYTNARQEHNEAQSIKALIYRFMLSGNNRENVETLQISELDSAIAGSRQPAKSILQSIEANVYFQYYLAHQWELRNRTNTVNFVKKDVATWTADDLTGKISSLYLASLHEDKLLEATRLDGYEPILTKGNVRILRPTLFDLLAHQALDYFKRTDANISRPADLFEIDDPVALGEASRFAHHRFVTTDTTSLHYTALLLFQQLISQHLTDARPDALIDVDIERVAFANSFGIMDNKDTLYMQALTRITDRYGDEPTAAEAWYLQADRLIYPTNGSSTSSKDTLRCDNVKARAICERVVAQKEDSEGRNRCRDLLNRLLEKWLAVKTEKVNLPGEPIRGLVNWSNFDHLYLRLVNVDKHPELLINYHGLDKVCDQLLGMPVYRQFDRMLPSTRDYRRHSAEIAIGSLPAGTYALVASADPNWSRENVLSVQYFYVSGIAFVNKGRDYFIVNRESGQPLSGATIKIWNQEYDPKKMEQVLVRTAESYTTDDQGHFLLRKYAQNEVYKPRRLEISTSNDHLFIRDAALPYDYVSPEEPDMSATIFEDRHTQAFLFLDRGIYRPGQTVYFKGIVVTKDKETHTSKARTDWPTKVMLYNANGEVVDSLDMKTNEFGSYHGTFRLPAGQLNGSFRVADATGNGVSFSVEEYKRPLFYVDYEKQTGSYRVGDSIHVTGNAKAYAGNVLDGAAVKYRVIRRARYPHPWYFWRGIQPAVGEQEIKHGEVKTDGKGAFRLTFLAAPDRSVARSQDPRFEYEVVADVTDINGETRSGSTTIVAGYTVLNLSIGVTGGDHQAADSLKELTLISTNLSGEPVVSTVHVAVYPLQSPNRLVRARLWTKPDLYALSEKEFLDSFPRDEYRDELEKESWARGGKVWEDTGAAPGVAGAGGTGAGGTTAAGGEAPGGGRTFRIPAGRLASGWYLIEATTTDAYGQEVKDIHYAELFDGKTGRPANPQYNWAVDQGQTVEPGGNAQVAIGTSAEEVFVIRKTERMEEKNLVNGKLRRISFTGEGEAPGNYTIFTLSKEKKITELAITEADRGGLGISDVFVRDNRVYTREHIIKVPWTNKQLTIHFTSFRDKTLPGSGEKWSMTIGGQNKDKVSAEVLAAMYDASLDQFSAHAWSAPALYPEFSGGSPWVVIGNFNSGISQTKPEATQQTIYVYQKLYDELIWGSNRGGMQVYASRGYYDAAVMPGMAVMRNAKPLAFGALKKEDIVATEDNIVYNIRGTSGIGESNKSIYVVDGIIMTEEEGKKLNPNDIVSMTVLTGADATALYGAKAANGAIIITTKKAATANPPVQVRKDFNETAFFFPDLRTDADGNLSFSFTMPDALTRWKWMTLAQTKDLSFGYGEKTIVTQKQLMVQPNAPRFLREGDHMDLAVKVVNLTDSEMTGQLVLQLTDPTTGQTADGWFTNRQPNQYFTVGAGQSAVVNFPLVVPFQYNRPVTYRVVAQARSYSDGEEATLPVVSNRMLVTETLPLNLKGDGTRQFKFEKLLQSGSSETLNHHALTVEFTANPTWYAVQSLPYLMEYPYECAEQVFNRFYSNALASKIVASSPRLQEVFSRWRTQDTAALLSNLQKNQELKTVLLEETPWVLQGKSESQQKKNVALLFDLSRMGKELETALDRLKAMQSSGGGFAWFKGGYDDLYITQYILTGLGHLQKLQAVPMSAKAKVAELVKAALPYVDAQLKKEYETARAVEGKKGAGAGKVGIPWIGELPVQYLYMRSFFSEYGIPGDVFPAVNYFRKKAQEAWVQSSKYVQGMIALSLFRTGDVQTAKDIIKSLRQNAIVDEEKGMYWKGMEGGYYWYQAPVEIQSLLIEAFREIGGDAAVDRDLKTWLLKQKQTHSWRTTKATADACYALLLGGQDWLNAEREVEIRLGEKVIEWGGDAGRASGTAGAGDVAGEAGTGYYKKVFDGPFVSAGMGNITVKMKSAGGTGATGVTGVKVGAGGAAKAGAGGAATSGGSPAWGAVYWQYFDILDRITPPGGNKAPLTLVKKLFIQRNTDRGHVLEPVEENGVLKPGDKVIVRIELKADRDMEYVHMKDMRAACMEPVNVISQYKWQGGLGYYESTKDASTDFFFSTLRRGTYVFEYPLLVGQAGNFSNGVTSIECMYAPEFAYHSEGIRVNVEGAP